MFDTGSTAFMMICAMLVLIMTPGVAFFYGGMSRRKNAVNTMFMSVATMGVVAVVWILVGWSFAYGGDGSIPFFGGFDQLGCLSAVQDVLNNAASHPDGGNYPSIVDIVFQLGVLYDHHGHHRRLPCRTYEIRSVPGVHRYLVRNRLCSPGSHGLGRRRQPDRRHDWRTRLRRRRRCAHLLWPYGLDPVHPVRPAQGLRHDELPRP